MTIVRAIWKLGSSAGLRIRSFIRERRGAVAIIVAAALLPLIGLAGLVLDVGGAYVTKRKVQGVGDLAAIAAATDVAHALAAARANAVDNGLPASDVANVEVGVYTPSTSVAPGNRFQPGGTAQTINAVRVTMTHTRVMAFGAAERVFGNLPAGFSITTTSIATQNKVASFALGSVLGNLNAGVLNTLLGSAFGSNVSLSVLGYDGLLSARVDLFAFAKALAVKIGQPGDTYGQIAGSTVSSSQFLAALAAVAPSAAPTLSSLASGMPAYATIDMTKLIEFGPYRNLSVTAQPPAVTASASVLSLLTAQAELGGASHLLDLSAAISVPGLASVTVWLTFGEPMQSTPSIAVDRIGASVHTAQIRLFVKAQVGVVGVASVTVPLYMEIAPATAVLSAISCDPLDGSKSSVTLGVTPGLGNLTIGSVTSADMTNVTAEPVPTPATFVNFFGVSVTGLVALQLGNLQPTPVNFSATDIQNAVVKSSATTDFAASALASALNGIQLGANIAGFAIAVPVSLAAPLQPILAQSAGLLDQLIAPVLQTLGIGLGIADTTVTGVKCKPANLAG